jgi:MFS transporter, OFA family, oxalate/formate antiporter
MRKSADLPQALHRLGIYYGWVILAAGSIGVIMSVPGQTMGVSVFTDHLLESLGISRVQLSLSYLCGTLLSGLLLPAAGRLLDRIGSRAMAVGAASFQGLFLLLLAASPFLAETLSSLSPLGPEWAALLITFFIFLGVRHFGQGQLAMSSRTMMGRWFERRRGLMLGLSGVLSAFGFGLAPLVLSSLIERLRWQPALVALAAASLLMAVFAWLFFRRSPEHCGLKVDGGLLDEPSTKPAADLSFSVDEAKKTLTFWIFNLGMVIHALLITAITFHMAHLGRLNGISSVQAFSIFLPLALIATVTDLISGYLSDRLPLKYLLAVMQLGICVGLLGLQDFGSSTGFAVTALGLGVASGHFSLLIGAAWPKLFGRQHLGSIAGLSMAWIVCGSALGPYLFSLGEANWGTYREVLYASALVPATLFFLSFFANQPTKKMT